MKEDKEHSCFDDERTRSNIEKYGLSVIMLEATDYLPSFAYSVGLWQKFKHPEIILFGLETKLMHAIINDVAVFVIAGQAIETGRTYTNIFKDSRAEFLKVDERSLADYLRYAIRFYNSRDFPALQLVWTDRNDKFSWEAGFEEEFIYKQPLLDRNADFKFRESTILGAFTTRQWLEQEKPILRVVHDVDGDWQFLTGDQVLEDARVVALEQLVLRDKTLNEVFDLEYGEAADREYVGGPWTRNKMPNDD